MIKFFRKIRYDLMEKNKTGKYLKYAIRGIHRCQTIDCLGIIIGMKTIKVNSEKYFYLIQKENLTSTKIRRQDELIIQHQIKSRQLLNDTEIIH